MMIVALCVIYLACGWMNDARQRQDVKTVRAIVDSEELILTLTPRLKDLNRSVLNLQLPDHNANGLLADQIDVIDLQADGHSVTTGRSATVGMVSRHWPIEPRAARVTTKELKMWRAMLHQVDYFEHAKFYFIRGQFLDNDPTLFRSEIGFSGLAMLKNGKWRAVKTKQEVHWRNKSRTTPDSENDPDWRIVVWHLKSLEFTDSDRLMFDEVLETALPDHDQRNRARKSLHHELLVKLGKDGHVPLDNEHYQRFFETSANGQHPALSVVDIDGDGWDDLYVMSRWGANQLLHNQGDGTFVERASALGLDVDGVSASGVFADFDNDGDKDLMLGRSLERSMYLVNERGHFVDRSDKLVSRPLPYLVASISAADYNGDGLLDVYLSTYGPPIGAEKGAKNWFDKFLTKEEARELQDRFRDSKVGHHRFVNRVGPRNLLLINRGGRFEVAPENEQLIVGYNTFQSTWADFDEDGDPDLYVSNDFAPDFLFRNDGQRGFVDVTAEMGGETMQGFGMGASWGDYDNDGRQDLYISNMYSKAGMRITSQISQLDTRFRQAADGNRLYRHCGDHFELVSGRRAPAMLVTQAGWSWGGQFVDMDNDGFLDIYVTSGYYTVPDEVATKEDS